MKTSTTTPRTSRKTPSTAAKATPAAAKAAPAPKARKVAAPRVRRAAPKKTTAPAGLESATPVPSPDAVRFRAYEIFLSRNGQGDELSDWLQAEHELFAQTG